MRWSIQLTLFACSASKYNIEKHLLKKASASPQKMGWTILRPVAFFDNMTPGMGIKFFSAMVDSMKGKKLQLISCRDIGWFGAEAFKDTTKYNGQAISLAGDELDLKDAETAFKETMGYDLPKTYTFMVRMLRPVMGEFGTMIQWFEDVGYSVDIPALRKTHPGLQDFGKWLKESSPFEAKK